MREVCAALIRESVSSGVVGALESSGEVGTAAEITSSVVVDATEVTTSAVVASFCCVLPREESIVGAASKVCSLLCCPSSKLSELFSSFSLRAAIILRTISAEEM